MTKLLSIAISLLILFQSSNIHFDDIAELDALIEHARFHSQEYGDNFLVFISKHYGELKAEHEKQHQEEKEDHEQLPFQHTCHVTSLSAFVLNQTTDYPTPFEIPAYSDANYFYQASYRSLALERILQPPRHV